MKRAIRSISWLVLASLLAIGPWGDTQTPAGPPGPSFLLQSAEDAECVHCILTANQPELEARLASGGAIGALRFKPLLIGGRSIVYQGSASFLNPGAPSPPPRSFSAASGSLRTWIFVHTAGAPAAIPPDQLFTVDRSGVPPLAPGASISSPQELQFLLYVLESLSDPTSGGPVAHLSRWFDASSAVSVESISVKVAGAQCSSTVTFRDNTAGSPAWTAWTISAIHTTAGYTQVTVR